MIKKIAILYNSTSINSFWYKILKTLNEDESIELIFILTEKGKESQTFGKFILKTEQKILSFISKDLKQEFKRYNISDILQTKPVSLNEIKDKNKLNLDLIIPIYSSCEIDENILNISKDGVIRVLFNKNRHTQNYPIAFWEIYNKEASIGFCIEHITKSSNKLLFKAQLATLRTVTQTKQRLLKESSPYILQTLTNYTKTGKFKKQKSPSIYSSMPKQKAGILHYLLYVLKTISLFIDVAFKRLVLKKYTRFSVAFLKNDWKDAKLYEAKEIKNPPYHFYADPFVWIKEDKTVCFVEDYDYKKNIASISAVEIFEDNSYKILGTVLKEPFHLSFPYLFEYKDTLYMIPESSANNSIRLYKCIEFPMKWKFEKYLMQDIKTADSMVFEHKNRWWLVTNMSTPANDDQAAQLFVFYADNPLSDKWTPHKNNPVVFNSNFGRNAGILFDEDGTVFRVRQKQKFNIYGAEFSIAKITNLTPQKYEEVTIASVKPDFFPKLKATHHMHSYKNITVYDFMRHERLNP